MQMSDATLMLDALSLPKSIIDLNELGLNNDHLNVLYETNTNVTAYVKCNNDISIEVVIDEVVLQGDTFS